MSKNYILNGNAQFGTRGVAAYADAVQSRPVDGVGGSPNVTITTSTASPLQGNAEFLFTKDAANRQGQGFSIDFTIDRADQAKPLQISFDWELVSGVFSGSTAPATDSDLIVYIYDVTNAVLIEPAGRLLEPAVTGQQYRYRGTFQASSNSTSYRLIFHVATTTTQDFTLGFDDIRVGPQVVSNGAVVTDWQSYTPTLTGVNLGTTGTNTGRWRRVGDSMELMTKAEAGGAGISLSGTIQISLPSGFSIDPNKITVAGFGQSLGSAVFESVGEFTRTGSVLYNTATTVFLTTPLNLADANNPSTGWFNAAGDEFSSNFRVPIAGWSSNVQVSSDTDTRVVALAARQVGAISVTANNPIPYANMDFDTHGSFNNPTAGRYRIPVSGIYRLSVTGLITSSTQAELELWVNGVNALDFTSVAANATRWDSGSVTRMLNAGDIVDVRPNATATLASYLFIERISGPSQIAASEAVYASATSTAGQSVPSGVVTIMQTNAKEYDSHSALQIGTNTRFTAPISGLYNFTAAIPYNSGQAWTEGNILSIELAKNGVLAKVLDSYNVVVNDASGGFVRLYGTADVWLNAGEFAEPRLFQNSGGARTLQSTEVALCYFQVKKVN